MLLINLSTYRNFLPPSLLKKQPRKDLVDNVHVTWLGIIMWSRLQCYTPSSVVRYKT